MKIKIPLFLCCIALIFIFACKSDPANQKRANTEAEELSEATQKAYLEKGKTIAATTFATLAGQLQKSIAEGGIPNAIQYCNLAALPLVDSLSKAHDATIKRTSLKVRNSQDMPTVLEEEILKNYEAEITDGKKAKPFVRKVDKNNIAFFAPIHVNEFCLKCHGEVGKTLTLENHKLIKKHYPEDKAIGYVDGELRGMWSISFEQK